MSTPELIVMLTKNDRTAENARAVFEACKDSAVQCWGAKDQGLPEEELVKLYDAFHRCGKTAFLEVVAYSERECMQGALLARRCGCEYLLGTVYFDSIGEFCRENGMKYMPFVGDVSGRPSALAGTAQQMLSQAQAYLQKGVYGIDLLGYRHSTDPYGISKEVVEKLCAPVCLAGSIDSYERLDQVRRISPAFFTVGGAFFDGRFGKDFCRQIDAVYDYIHR